MLVYFANYIKEFDVVIQLITASFFALNGMSFFSNTFESVGQDFKKKNEKIFDYLATINNFDNIDEAKDPKELSNEGNDVKISRKKFIKKHKQLELFKFRCQYNLMTKLYKDRISELFYKAGIFCVFVLAFSAFLRSDENLLVTRILPVTVYSFFCCFFLSRRLFCVIKDDHIISDITLYKSDNILEQFTSPFVINDEKGYKKYKNMINPKFVDDNNGRKIKKRLLLHTFILLFLLHLNWFGVDLSFIPDDKNLNKLYSMFVIATCVLPFLILFAFYVKNVIVLHFIEKKANMALKYINDGEKVLEGNILNIKDV